MSGLRIEDGPRIREVVLDRPKVNALDAPTLRALAACFDEASRSERVDALLLRAEGRCFSAGLDLRVVIELDERGMSDFLDALDACFIALLRCSCPVAAAVEGHAIAGGLLLALGADFCALAPGNYKLGLTELQVGIPFPRPAFEIARLALPPRGLRRIAYEANLYGVEEAFELGVGDRITAQPVEAARAWLQERIERPLPTFTIAKREIREEAWGRLERTASERAELLNALFSPPVRAALKAAAR